jgi:hypothetical protein
VECQGAGGGASGIASPGASKFSVGRAGGGGAWLRVKLTANFSGASYSVGAKGAGGAAGDNSGVNGGNTTFTTTGGSPVTYTAGGGTGGNNGGSSIAAVPNLSNGVAGGTATGGDDNLDGFGSQIGVVQTVSILQSGGGGPSRYSAGSGGQGIFSANTSAAGSNANGKGGGGGAPAGSGTGVARAGGDGSDGMIVIWEFS